MFFRQLHAQYSHGTAKVKNALIFRGRFTEHSSTGRLAATGELLALTPAIAGLLLVMTTALT